MKRETIIYVEDKVLRALKVAAARAGQHECQIIEQYCGLTWGWICCSG